MPVTEKNVFSSVSMGNAVMPDKARAIMKKTMIPRIFFRIFLF